MEVSNAFGSKLAQQKSDSAETYEFYVKMAKLQSDFETNKQVAEINQKEKLFQMELEQKRLQTRRTQHPSLLCQTRPPLKSQ